MFRYAVIALVLGLIILIVRQLTQGRTRPPRERRLREQHMVRCAHCGLHLPEPEAIRTADGYYCSDSHRLADRSDT